MKASVVICLISIDDVLVIHEKIITRFGGRQGVHNLELLESALGHLLMVLDYGDNEELDISYLAATYFFHIIKNHPFVDGNKRTGLLTAINFLYYNGYEFENKFENIYEDLYQLSLKTADSTIQKKEIAMFFKKTIKKIQ